MLDIIRLIVCYVVLLFSLSVVGQQIKRVKTIAAGIDWANNSVGSWEPSHNTELWKKKKQLNLFLQFTYQKDGEDKADIAHNL